MAKYRKKPVVIEAVRWTGDNRAEMIEFMRDFPRLDEVMVQGGKIEGEPYCELVIPTLKGDMRAQIGEYIIKGVQGEFYPCKPDIFEQTYERLN